MGSEFSSSMPQQTNLTDLISFQSISTFGSVSAIIATFSEWVETGNYELHLRHTNNDCFSPKGSELTANTEKSIVNRTKLTTSAFQCVQLTKTFFRPSVGPSIHLTIQDNGSPRL